MKREKSRSKKMPSNKIGFGFLISGIMVFLGSYVTSSTVLAFIGLGLTFWGGLFLFARPVKYVKSILLDSTAVSFYKTIEMIMTNLNYQGKPMYIPPYPKQAYLPAYLRGLKETRVIIPAQDITSLPSIEELTKTQFTLKNPRGIFITPPGYGLVDLFEKQLETEFSQISLEDLYTALPNVVVSTLELAKEFEINAENNLVHVKMINSVYSDLYLDETGLRSVHSLGCPLSSAVACTLAKVTGKAVMITKDAFYPDLNTIEVWYRILEV